MRGLGNGRLVGSCAGIRLLEIGIGSWSIGYVSGVHLCVCGLYIQYRVNPRSYVSVGRRFFFRYCASIVSREMRQAQSSKQALRKRKFRGFMGAPISVAGLKYRAKNILAIAICMVLNHHVKRTDIVNYYIHSSMGKITVSHKLSYHSDDRNTGSSPHRGFSVQSIPRRPACDRVVKDRYATSTASDIPNRTSEKRQCSRRRSVIICRVVLRR
jgi:hypothetical protein